MWCLIRTSSPARWRQLLRLRKELRQRPRLRPLQAARGQRSAGVVLPSGTRVGDGNGPAELSRRRVPVAGATTSAIGWCRRLLPSPGG